MSMGEQDKGTVPRTDTAALVKAGLALSADIRSEDGVANLAVAEMADRLEEQAELLEMAWGVIANASGGDWQKETAPWRVAATRWRDRYLGTP